MNNIDLVSDIARSHQSRARPSLKFRNGPFCCPKLNKYLEVAGGRRPLSPELTRIVSTLERTKPSLNSGEGERDIKKYMVPLVQQVQFFQMD